MNARDLRIGNIVFDKSRSEHDFEKLGNGIYRVSAHAIERFDAGFMDLKPVHLTSEWLERIDWAGYKDFYFNSYCIDEYGHLYYGGDYTGINVVYVHQLQNLYFALIGSELQLKEHAK